MNLSPTRKGPFFSREPRAAPCPVAKRDPGLPLARLHGLAGSGDSHQTSCFFFLGGGLSSHAFDWQITARRRAPGMLPLCREPQGKGRLQKPLQGSLGCQGGGLSPKWLWFAATLVVVPSPAPRTLTAPISRWVGVQRGRGDMASGDAPRAAKQDPGLASHIGASAHGFEKGTCGRGARRRICRPGTAFLVPAGSRCS